MEEGQPAQEEEEEGLPPHHHRREACHGIYCPTRIMSGGQNMAAIFGPGQNMADTFCPGGQNVAARFSPILQYMVRARTIRGRSFSPGGQNVAANLVLPVPCNMVRARTIILCSSVHEAWGLLP